MKISDPASKPSFLVVEDSDEDYVALERILKRNKVSITLQRCTRAEDVLVMLNAPVLPHRPPPALPALIVLDLNLPGLDGREVLTAVRQHPRMKRTPVVIFSTSSSPHDIAWCYENGANSYHVKDTDYSSFKRAVELLVDYWLEAVKLPHPHAPNSTAILDRPDE